MRYLSIVFLLLSGIAWAQCVQDGANPTTLACKGTTVTKIPAPTAGPQGPVGPAGPQGSIGPRGLPGQDGAQGPAGQQGVPGKDGAPGQPGKDGKDGASGAPGATGPQGSTGPQGPPGQTPTITADPSIDWTKVDPNFVGVLSIGTDNQTLHCTLRSGQPCKF